MKLFLFTLSLILLLVGCGTNNNSSNTVSIINIQTVADSLILFGENVISTSLYERDLAINPKGDEIIYTLGDYKQSKRSLVIVNKENGSWGDPEIMSISGKYHDIEPFYTKGGERLFFASNRPIYSDSTRNDYNIWFSDKIENAWTAPKALDTIINTKGNEFFPSLSDAGNLYFTATRKNGIGREDIFISRLVAGKFESPEPLPSEVNSKYYEFNAYISPKEDLLIFSSYGRTDGMGGGDLYISRKDQNGIWKESVNMGELVNSDKLDFCPFIDWNNGNFYFTSERVNNGNTELQSIDDIKSIANNAENGFGNIYKIGLDKLDGIE